MPRVILRSTGRGYHPLVPAHSSAGKICARSAPRAAGRHSTPVCCQQHTQPALQHSEILQHLCGRLGTCLWRGLRAAASHPPGSSSPSVKKFFAPSKVIDCSLVSRQSSPDVSKRSLLVCLPEVPTTRPFNDLHTACLISQSEAVQSFNFQTSVFKEAMELHCLFLTGSLQHSSLSSIGLFQGFQGSS